MEEQQRQFKGIWIPKEIWMSEELSTHEKIMLVEIDSLETDDKGCYATNKYFANFFKLTTQRTSQIIQSLKDKGYLKIEYLKSGKEIIERKIRINKPPYPDVSNKIDRYQENYDTGIKYIREGYQENVKENNITINNINNNKKESIKKKNTKPSIEEIEEYCSERDNGINAEAFFDFYESKNWYVGKNKIQDWKACVRTWEKRNEEKDKYRKTYQQKKDEEFDKMLEEVFKERETRNEQ